MAKEKMVQNEVSQEYWAYVKRQFRKNKRALFSAYFVGFMAFIAIFADFLANDKPIACKYKGAVYFPIIKSYGVSFGISKWNEELKNVNWTDLEYDWVVRALIPYSPTTIDLFNSQYASPFDHQSIKSIRWKHWLGTESLGRDILSCLIHGTRIAFTVGIFSMLIASFLGITLGALAGYFGDNRLKISRASFIMVLLGGILGWFEAFSVRSYTLSAAFEISYFKGFLQLFLSIFIFITIVFLFIMLGKIFKIVPFFRKKTAIPIDILVQRIIEILLSIPRMFLLIALVAIVKTPSINMVTLIIGFTYWTEIARFIRAELLRIRSLEYVEAAEALGFSSWRILFKHAIPNALSPVLITIAFGIASAVLVEATLSFLGVGVPAEMLTWGKLLSEARTAPSAWWLAIFPGFAIFITVTLFNLIGEGLTDALDPRQKK